MKTLVSQFVCWSSLASIMAGIGPATAVESHGEGQRTVAVLKSNPAVSNLIREGKTHLIPNVIETSGKAGMYTMDRSLQQMAAHGIIVLTAALSKARDPERVSGRAAPAGGPA